MNFRTYASKEDPDFKTIFKNVDKEYLKIVCKQGYVYRGQEEWIDTYKIFKTRKSREPLNMPEKLHLLLDKAFKKTFGWNVRSEGVFCAGQDQGYGNPYLFFPIGKYKYVWSKRIGDLFLDIDGLMPLSIRFDSTKKIPFTSIESYFKFHPEALEKGIKDNFNDSDLKTAIASYTGNEIVFKCNKYLLVNLFYKDKITERIKEKI